MLHADAFLGSAASVVARLGSRVSLSGSGKLDAFELPDSPCAEGAAALPESVESAVASLSRADAGSDQTAEHDWWRLIDVESRAGAGELRMSSRSSKP